MPDGPDFPPRNERLPMPHGRFDPLIADPYRGPCISCGEDADFSVALDQFICSDCFCDPAYAGICGK